MPTPRPIVLAATLLALVGAPCASEPDLPDGWTAANRVVSTQSPRQMGEDVPVHPGLKLTRDMAGLRGTYQDAAFGCGRRLCAYRQDRSGLVGLLVQPCDMGPAPVAPACLYAVSFPLDEVVPGTMVELYRRDARVEPADEPPAKMVDRQRSP